MSNNRTRPTIAAIPQDGREAIRTALYKGLEWFGTLPEPEGDVPERYHRWDDLGELADRILAALQAADHTAQGREMVLEEAAQIAERRAEERFAEYGVREPDTNACYYDGAAAEINEALDEECEAIANAIRALKDQSNDRT